MSLLKYECSLWEQGFESIAGIDEAGRGPLAGPVVASAVIFEKDFLIKESCNILSGLTDSKLLSPKKREHFFSILTNNAHIDFSIGIIEVEEIDRINILRATHKAMLQAVNKLKKTPDYMLIDGLPVDDLNKLDIKSEAIIKGDQKSISIAAASVIAKVYRDNIMLDLDKRYPQYSFSKHKGYGTKLHVDMLKLHGPILGCHRLSFKYK